MKRLDKQTTQFTEQEMLVMEIHELLLDQGHDPQTALTILRGLRVPEGLRTDTPYLDEVLTPEFINHLLDVDEADI